MGIFGIAGFMPAVASCYQVHALNTNAHTSITEAQMYYFTVSATGIA